MKLKRTLIETFKPFLLFIAATVLLFLGFFFIGQSKQTSNINLDSSTQIFKQFNNLKDQDLVQVKISENNRENIVELEIAKTTRAQQVGLMERKSMKPNQGMLFIFNTSEPRTFWMKNTLIPVDIIFLDKDFKIVKIHKNTKINQTQEVYSSQKDAQYVIELNAGKTSEYNWLEGNLLTIESIQKLN